jgi:NAD+ synthase (glutamine-hydrolysing)
MQPPSRSIYSYNFLRVAVCTPQLKVATTAFNLAETLDLARQAAAQGAALAIFPELGLSAYSNEDLFFQDPLLDEVNGSIAELVEQSRALFPVLVVGAPLRIEAKLFNCAIVIHRGRILGLVPKMYLPNYREFYEKRQLTSGADAITRTARLGGVGRGPSGGGHPHDRDRTARRRVACRRSRCVD